MPSIVRIMNWNEINIDASVGRGGVNNQQDVLVIQAMLKFALEGRSYFKGDVFPMPTGVIDGNTLNLIEKYQRYVRRKQDVKVSVDGRIDPSKGLYVKDKRQLFWTIVKLNGDASEMSLIHHKGGNGDHIRGIRNMYPQVDAILAGTAVGTLNLALE